MPICPQCAKPVPDSAQFCPACGAAAARTAPARSEAADTRTAPASSRPPSSTSHTSVHGRFEPGTRLGSRYRIVALLGRGGMGEVYRADDLELGQSVALKFLPPGVASNATELARFRGEVRTARLIAHPNVCRVYDIGDSDGHVFLSMEYIDGEDLASVLRRMGRPTPDKALEIARQVCMGLAAAHETGMLHRDLKPANIMIDGRGRARITDFGLAGLAADFSREGDRSGTPAYMAPEQLAEGRASVRSDLYSLGLVLYELFTGKRAFEATNVGDLRRMQDSGTFATPSNVARDIDPAVERLILQCLESNPDSRPPSAYAVLGALPGGDPLAAAIAAGETPSPELVANAGQRGGLSTAAAAGIVAIALLGIGTWAGLCGPEFKVFTQPAAVLSVRAGDILAKTGALEVPPSLGADGFEQNDDFLEHTKKGVATGLRAPGAAFYWRLWTPLPVRLRNIHENVPRLGRMPLVGVGEAIVQLDPEGRLVGLRAIPADTARALHGGRPEWSAWLAAAGLDTSLFAPAPLLRPVPAACDTAAAWAGPVPALGGRKATVEMGACRGRLAYFTMVSDWGTTTHPVDFHQPFHPDSDWLDFLIYQVLTLGASIFFAVRNLRMGRGDRVGATRIALFVFAMNILESVSTARLSQVGLISAGSDWLDGSAFGHSLIHGVTMWFAYVALEPYVRRLWPTMLVSWARLVSGRLRDPLVGRDLLIGAAFGSLLVALSVLTDYSAVHLGWARVPTLVGGTMLAALSGFSSTGCYLAYAGSVCVLNVLEALVLLLVLRLLLRRTWLAATLSILLLALSDTLSNHGQVGWTLAIVHAVLPALWILLLLRVGLLATAAASWVGLIMGGVVATTDLSSWYSGLALLPLLLLLGLVGYGAATSLTGKSILGDPLKDVRGR